MSVKEAALAVLRQAKTPLSAQEITERMLAKGLWHTTGKTPAATVAAQLYMDIKKQGVRSAFVKTDAGLFGVRAGASPATTQRSKQARAMAMRSSGNGTFTDCAEKVLQQFAGKQPMHYREITDKALENGWLNTEGKTPEATMYAQILTEIRRQQQRGDIPRFAQYGRGMVGLTQWLGVGLEFDIAQHNQQLHKALRKRLLTLSAGEFEELVGQLLAKMGFETVEVTRISRDGGIDVRGTLVIGDTVRIKMAVQAKRWQGNVLAPIVQQVRGSLGAHEQGLIVTTSRFSKGAMKEAVQSDKTPIALMDGEQLAGLLMEHSIGVERSTHDLFKLDEVYWAADETQE